MLSQRFPVNLRLTLQPVKLSTTLEMLLVAL
jgi:hypothetical protein